MAHNQTLRWIKHFVFKFIVKTKSAHIIIYQIFLVKQKVVSEINVSTMQCNVVIFVI